MNNLLKQLARNTGLLPEPLSAEILAGGTPPVEDVVRHLVIGTLDAHAVIAGDPESSRNDRRIARLMLAVAFLSAMAILGQGEE
jgi:hypothetical protein